MFLISNEMSKEGKILNIFKKGSANCSTEQYVINAGLKTSSRYSTKMNKVDCAKRYSHFYLQKFEVFEEVHS